jgi:SWIB/MDM2 domain
MSVYVCDRCQTHNQIFQYSSPLIPLNQTYPYLSLSTLPQTKSIQIKTQVTRLLHIYFKANNIPDPADGRILLLNAPLKSIFGTDQMTIFLMQRELTKHLTPVPDLDVKSGDGDGDGGDDGGGGGGGDDDGVSDRDRLDGDGGGEGEDEEGEGVE